jgi:hypothetical protein
MSDIGNDPLAPQREDYWGVGGLCDRLWAIVENSSYPNIVMLALKNAAAGIEDAAAKLEEERKQ